MKQVEGIVATICKNEKGDYLKNLLLQNQNHPKKFWDIVGKIVPNKIQICNQLEPNIDKENFLNLLKVSTAT